MTQQHGATVSGAVTTFRVRAPKAQALWLCLFEGETEHRLTMIREGADWVAELPRNLSGTPYGYRAEGQWAPEDGSWFDPAKLLVDPYAVELDRRFVQHPDLARFGADTAAIVPRAVVPAPLAKIDPAPPRVAPGDLIYEINVRGFTMLHPDIPEALRGTVAALAHPSVIAHLKKLGVGAVELMPIVAWIDERHLPPLGLSNAWGYNPVAMRAVDPGLCPGGLAELRETVAALHAEGIGVILDLVFNHTGESDIQGGVLSLRGLDNDAYAHAPDGSLINDTGCGNTLDFANPFIRRLTIDALRHFVSTCGIDGFRFDLATILARGPGFAHDAPIFAEILADPILSDRLMIAEPWDCGPGGYQLGRFPDNWLEWNDRYRDDVRRFWRGDGSMGDVVTRIAGSSDIFGPTTRTVNFLAAHDGFTLADTLAYAERHNDANGEGNRDGHAENFSWNCGLEGPTDDPAILARRQADARAMLATLFASTGTILLAAGDAFGRTQKGNNNAYAQDNAIGWVDWAARDLALEDFVADLAAQRSAHRARFPAFPQNGDWQDAEGREMTADAWENPATQVVRYCGPDYRLTISRPDRTVAWDIPS